MGWLGLDSRFVLGLMFFRRHESTCSILNTADCGGPSLSDKHSAGRGGSGYSAQLVLSRIFGNGSLRCGHLTTKQAFFLPAPGRYLADHRRRHWAGQSPVASPIYRRRGGLHWRPLSALPVEARIPTDIGRAAASLAVRQPALHSLFLRTWGGSRRYAGNRGIPARSVLRRNGTALPPVWPIGQSRG